MLSREDNELITRIGPGTAMGELFRRFWQPVLLASELPRPDCRPVRVRILGEDLVAFRDSAGQAGVVAESNFREKVQQRAYPTREMGGLVWAYLGPAETIGELPQFEWARVPPEHLHISKWSMEANYLQGMEGEIDASHISFLHTIFDPTDAPALVSKRRVGNWRTDTAPRLMLMETEYGFVYGARRSSIAGDEYHWRVTHWLFPTYSLIPGPVWPVGGRCWVPIDDQHTWVFNYWYNADEPLAAADLEWIESGVLTPPRVDPVTFRPLLNKANEYGRDYEAQRTRSYTGIFGGGTQDRAVVESMGPVYDRTREHLGTAGIAIITARRTLLEAARRLQDGSEPFAAGHGDCYHVRALDVVSRADMLDAVLDEHRAELLARV